MLMQPSLFSKTAYHASNPNQKPPLDVRLEIIPTINRH